MSVTRDAVEWVLYLGAREDLKEVQEAFGESRE